jgi:hypothetical protein
MNGAAEQDDLAHQQRACDEAGSYSQDEQPTGSRAGHKQSAGQARLLMMYRI